MNVSTTSSFYEPPVEYDERKTIQLYEKLKTNFQDIEKLLGGAQKNLSKVQKESALTVKLIEKLKSAEAQVANHQHENQNVSQSRNKSRNN